MKRINVTIPARRNFCSAMWRWCRMWMGRSELHKALYNKEMSEVFDGSEIKKRKKY